MKIFSNDYLANLPTDKQPTKGGPAKFSRSFQSWIISKGYEWVGLVSETHSDKFKSSLVYSERKKKWWKVIIPSGYMSKNFTTVKKFQDPYKTGSAIVGEIKKILNIEKPDLVFLNGFWCLNWAILRAANDLKIPIVSLHAGVWNVEIDTYADFYSPAGVRTMKQMEIDAALYSTRNIFLNKTTRDYFQKNIYKIPKQQVEIIPLPCEDLVISNSKKKKVRKGVINIGIVARWDRIKNHKAFHDFAMEAKKQNKKWNFFAVTTIPQTDRFKEFKASYSSLIKVFRPMSQRSLVSFYQNMDFMLLPSLFDVSPHVVVEAALEGVPTFISKNVGYAGLFKENDLNDFIIDFSNSAKAVNKISKMENFKYPSHFIKLLKEIHDPDKIFSKYDLLFNKLIHK